ncbi:MAG: trypsin-like peptidase domain-containing protein, partial [Dehalococcoidia bacterium]
MNRRLFLAVLVAALVGLAACTEGETPPSPSPTAGLITPQIVARLTPSVVQIAVEGLAGRGVGTGVVYDNRGHILTNWHVVNGATDVRIASASGTILSGELFRADPLIDLAIIRVNSIALTPAVFGDSDALLAGEDVIAIGHALGLPGGPTVSKGVISALNRTILGAEDEQLAGVIQTDAPINQGNSGGPLANMRGKVIGINTAKTSAGEDIGFAININAARETVGRLIELGPPPPPGYLGAFGIDITPALASVPGLPVSSGFGVTEVEPASPAAQAGIHVDDIIIRMDNEPIQNGAALTQFLREHPAGTVVTMRVVRGSRFAGFILLSTEVTLGERVN